MDEHRKAGSGAEHEGVVPSPLGRGYRAVGRLCIDGQSVDARIVGVLLQDRRGELHLAARSAKTGLLVFLVSHRGRVGNRHAGRMGLELRDPHAAGLEDPIQGGLKGLGEVGGTVRKRVAEHSAGRLHLVVQPQLVGQSEDDVEVRTRLAQGLDDRSGVDDVLLRIAAQLASSPATSRWEGRCRHTWRCR